MAVPTTTATGRGWKVLQVLIGLLLLANLWQQRSPPCLPPRVVDGSSSLSTSASSPSLRLPPSESAKTKSNTRPYDYHHYSQPVSDRVPPQGIETILVTSSTQPSFHIFAYPSKLDLVTPQLLEQGVYEKDSTTAVIDAIVCTATATASINNDDKPPPMLVLDLGANIGFHSLHMASCGAQVLAFEASPDTAWLLRSSAALNGFTQDRPTSGGRGGGLTVIPKGVSNVTSSGRLSRHQKSPGMTSFVATSQTAFSAELHAGATGTALDVDIPLVRAQDVLAAFDINSDNYRLRFVKVDVEGFEYQALQGLNLQQYPFEYITLEFFPNLLQASGHDPADLLVYIWSQGYRFLEFHAHQKVQDYPLLETGTTRDAVHQWATKLVQQGRAKQGDNYHVNLLAQHHGTIP